MIYNNPEVTRNEISKILGDITPDGVKYHLEKMKSEGIIAREGATKKGKWIILNKG